MTRTSWILALIALVSFGWVASRVVEVGNSDPRPVGSATHIAEFAQREDTNVLFVLVDTLRADRLSSYGYERETSPMLDYMAGTGVRFARHLAQSSWTKCSMASLWTGLYPVRTGVLRSEHGMPEEAVFPAEVLRDAGFRTAGVWRNGWVAPNFGFGQGFEVYERPRAIRRDPRVKADHPHVSLGGSDLDVLETAREFLRVHGRERWFLYVHLMDVHQYLYDESTALFGSTYSDIYDNSIRHEDDVVSQLLSDLAESGLLEKTLVVIGADHGEAFLERGLEGHARHVFRESTEVPLILGFPFKLEPGLVVETRTRNVDIWPTVFDLLGLDGLPDVDGESLVPEILASAEGRSLPDDRPAFAHLEQGWGQRGVPTTPVVAVALGSKRFVAEKGRADGQEYLFDRESDEREIENRLASDPEAAASLRALVESYFESPPAPWGTDALEVEIDELEMDQLRALGYR